MIRHATECIYGIKNFTRRTTSQIWLQPSNPYPKIIIDSILGDLKIKPYSIGDTDTRTSPAAVEADTIGTIFKSYNFGIK